MTNEKTGENQPNQENDGQQIERLRNERNDFKKKSNTMEAQKSHWKKKAEAKAEKPAKAGKPAEAKKSNEPDYTTKLAEDTFLEQRGFKNSDDQKYIRDEAGKTGKNIKEVLDFKYVQEKLKTDSEQREAQAGMPKGKGSSGKSSSKDVDYWIAKGETPTDDLELAGKVIQAKMDKEEKGNMFSEELYTG